MDKKKSLIKNTFILALGTVLPKLSSLVTLPIITGALTKSEMGIYDLVMTTVPLLQPIVTLQIQSAAFRFLIDVREEKNEVKKIVTNIVSYVVPVTMLSMVALYLGLYKLDFGVRLFICLYFFANILIACFQQIARGLSYNKLFSISAVIVSLSNLALVVGVVLLGQQGLTGVLFSATVANFAGLIALLIKGKILNRIDFRLLSKNAFFKMLAYSWPMIPNSLSNWVLSVSDRTVISIFIGTESNAIYAVANKIPALIAIAQGTFVFAWQENASIASKDDDADSYYSEMFDNVFCIMIGILAMLIATSPILFKLLIHGDYTEAYQQIPLLFMGLFFSAIASFVGGIYVAYKKTKSVGITTIIAAVINIVIDLLLINRIGIWAASISTVISYLFLVIYRMIDVTHFQKMYYKHGKIAIYIAMMVGMCFLSWKHFLIGDIVNFALGITIASAANFKTVKKLFKKVFGGKKNDT